MRRQRKNSPVIMTIKVRRNKFDSRILFLAWRSSGGCPRCRGCESTVELADTLTLMPWQVWD
jgi:hypothetical protein